MRSAIVKPEGKMMVVTASRMLGTENWMYWRKARDCQRPIFLMNQSGLPAAASAEAPAKQREWEEYRDASRPMLVATALIAMR